MTLLEELQQQRVESLQRWKDHQKYAFEWQQNADADQQRIADLDTAIAALSPPAPEVEAKEPEIPEGFMPWACEAEWPLEPGDGRVVEVLFRDGMRAIGLCGDFEWAADIIAYRILSEAPATDAPPVDAEPPPVLDAEHFVDLTPEQQASIDRLTADFQSTEGSEIISGEPWPAPDADPIAQANAAIAQTADELEGAEPAPPEPVTTPDADVFAHGMTGELRAPDPRGWMHMFGVKHKADA